MKVIFIVKPTPVKRLEKLRDTLDSIFKDQEDSFFIYESLRKGHAVTLTQKAVANKADVVVACGGDGTINEVARELVGTDIKLGIIPMGSGNGIARHFKIPFDMTQAIGLIKKNQYLRMDVGMVNGHYFFGNMGCALESHFIRHYQKNGHHGIRGYIVAFLQAIIGFKYQKIILEIDKKKISVSPLVFLVSNTNQHGYDFTFTPHAKIDDGQLDLFWTERLNRIKMGSFFINILRNKNLKHQEFNLLQSSSLKISLAEDEKFIAQVDGELLDISEKTLCISLIPKTLKVIVPE
jgi:diacylglycerol kinase (ATP)